MSGIEIMYMSPLFESSDPMGQLTISIKQFYRILMIWIMYTPKKSAILICSQICYSDPASSMYVLPMSMFLQWGSETEAPEK